MWGELDWRLNNLKAVESLQKYKRNRSLSILPVNWALVPLQEWKRQRTHSEAHENLRGGDARHPVRRRLRERGKGMEKLQRHVMQLTPASGNNANICVLYQAESN